MDPVLAYAQAAQPKIVEFTKAMVECETPSGDAAAIGRFVDLFTESTKDIAKFRTKPGGKWGPHLICEFNLAGRKATRGHILGLGHSDTVYEMGTLKTMPWRDTADRLHGPGVLDMKAGLAFFVFAMRALRDLDIPVHRKVLLQINSEEEVGSPSSRAVTELNAQFARAVLVLEPGTGLTGKLKTARKGIGRYQLTVHGQSAHAGVDFTAGASAIVELAHQVEAVAAMTDLKKGRTLNPGVISGGSRSNVIADHATCEIDLRAETLADAAIVDRKLKALKPHDKRCRLELAGGLNRPPMERTKGIAELYKIARQCGERIGVNVEESSTGGGSDGNFTAALGIPTLDGLGAVGEGAHAPHESILKARIADRVALLALLTASL
jgi:glutamate carboxypeptidase